MNLSPDRNYDLKQQQTNWIDEVYLNDRKLYQRTNMYMLLYCYLLRRQKL
jgi:hypothetical protein